MTTGGPALFRAIYQKLSDDSGLADMDVQIYDEVPETATHPYISFGDPNERKDDQHDSPGLDIDFTLHVWTRYRGYKQASEIVEQVHKVLDRQPLTVDGFKYVSIFADGARFQRDPNPDIRHGVAPFRVWLTQDNS